jgi:branched-chain amino acid transport system permease protein
MTEVIQQIINALSLGGTYALLALGLAVVFSIFKLINFAHGDLMTICGYAIYLAMDAGVPGVPAAVIGVIAAGVAAVLMERIAFRPLRGAEVPTLLLASLALSIGLQVLFQDIFSARPQAIKTPAFLTDTVSVGSLAIPVVQLVSIGITFGLLVLLTVGLRRTTLGIAMRAAAENFPVVRLMGINANRVIATAFLVSGLLAGVAAILWIAQRGSVGPTMGLLPMFKAFIAAILGGLGSLTGAVVGGFALAAIEVSLQALLPDSVTQYQSAIIFLAVIALLTWRPEGLVGSSSQSARLRIPSPRFLKRGRKPAMEGKP